MLLDLDPSTAYMDPFTKHPTLNITCFVKDPITGEDYSRDPRNIAKKAEFYLEQTGIADTAFFGPEAEFYIFDSIRYDQNEFEGYYHVDSVAGAWQSGQEEDGGNLGYKPRYKGGYFPLPPMDKYQDLRTDMVLNLEKAGLTIEVHHHEVGTAGQAEIDMRFDTLLTTADNVMKYKYVVKNTAYQAGKTVTFMPKPLFRTTARACTRTSSLWTGGEPLFWDEIGYGGISDLARWYIGGLLAARARAAGVHEPDDELVPPAGARLRGADQARVLAAEPERLRAHPGLRARARRRSGSSSARPTRRATRTSRSRDADGRPRRHQEQDRAAGADRQGPVRPAARREGEREAGPGGLDEVLNALEADHQWLLEGGVFTPGRDRHLDRVQADERARRGAAAPAPVRVLRCTTTSEGT